MIRVQGLFLAANRAFGRIEEFLVAYEVSIVKFILCLSLVAQQV
jgi:hypothetical protein